jgi:putative hydrolase of the HAD superfamily
MAKNLIFDFGNVLLPIEEDLTWQAFAALGARESLKQQGRWFKKYETGQISTDAFLKELQPHFFRKSIFKNDLAQAWCQLCHAPIPADTLALLKGLKKKSYHLFLLSNTNALHIAKIKKSSGLFNYNQFIGLFKQVYYSHEVGLRKPDAAFYQKVLNDNGLKPEDCWFADDKKKNIKAAAKLGMQTFHFKPEEHNPKTLEQAIAKLG